MTDLAQPPQTLTTRQIKERLDALPDPYQVNRLIDLLARIYNLTDHQLGDLVGESRSTARNTRQATRRLRPADIHAYAEALQVSTHDLLGQPSEVLARFITEHRIGDEQVATNTLLSLSEAARGARCRNHLARAS